MKREMDPRKKGGSAADCMQDTRKRRTVCEIKLRVNKSKNKGYLPHLGLKGYSGVRYQ